MRPPSAVQHAFFAALGCVLSLGVAVVVIAAPPPPADPGVQFTQKLHEIRPDDAAGFANLGRWAEQQHLPAQAASAYRRSLSISPDSAQVYDRLVAVADTLRLDDEPALQAKLKTELGPRFSVHLSPHFLVVYDTDSAWARNRAVLLEATHDAFYRAFRHAGMKPRPLERRLACVLFQKQKDFLAYALATDGVKLDWSSGYYSGRTNRIAFFNDDSNHAFAKVQEKVGSLEQTIARLTDQARSAEHDHNAALLAQYRRQIDAARHQRRWYLNRKSALAVNSNAAKTTHEAAHQLAYNSGIQTPGVLYPFWLAEGLATNFEAADPAASFGPYCDNPNRRRALTEARHVGRLTPLAELITITAPPTRDLARTNDLYAESWSLMQFLFRRHQDEFRRYLLTLAKLPPGPRPPGQLTHEFESAFGPTAPLEKQWLASLKSN